MKYFSYPGDVDDDQLNNDKFLFNTIQSKKQSKKFNIPKKTSSLIPDDESRPILTVSSPYSKELF